MHTELQPSRAEIVRARATMYVNEFLASAPEAHPWWRADLLDALAADHAGAPVWAHIDNHSGQFRFIPYGMNLEQMIGHPSTRHSTFLRFPSSVWDFEDHPTNAS